MSLLSRLCCIKDQTITTLKKVTIVEVAELAGVSVSAVSRAFNPQASCSDKMRAKVMAAAGQLGYKPNRLARGIRAQSKLIGILVTDFENPAYLTILNQFTRSLQEKGYHSLLINVGEGMSIHEAVELVMEYQVDGLIVTSSVLPQQLTRVCQQQQIPVIIFARHSQHNPVSTVCCNNIAGGRMAAERLIAAGYQRFAFIGGVEGASTTIDRQRGFISRLVELQQPQWQVVSGGQHDYDSGFAATCKLFTQPEPPDGLFFTNDILAFGGMDAVRYEFGLRVAAEVGIIGFDDITAAAHRAYDLTTVSQPFTTMVEATVDRLLAEIRQYRDDILPAIEQIVLDCHLVERGTVREAGYRCT
ncbi:MAG: LacI family DNA-binding transcriptional regulator [Thiolinea sp.]